MVIWFMQVLLEQGADPRIHADDGAVPQQVGEAWRVVYTADIYSITPSFVYTWLVYL